MIGDIELFCRARKLHAPDAPFVAITGTNSAPLVVPTDAPGFTRSPIEMGWMAPEKQFTLFLDDVTVSRRHAEIRLEGTHYLVSDVGSLNGTYLNGDRVDVHELAEGDQLQVGKYRLVFAFGAHDGDD